MNIVLIIATIKYAQICILLTWRSGEKDGRTVPSLCLCHGCTKLTNDHYQLVQLYDVKNEHNNEKSQLVVVDVVVGVAVVDEVVVVVPATDQANNP